MPEVHAPAAEQIYFNVSRHELFVSFTSGQMYVYFGVPQQEYGDLLAAPSPGQYFTERVRDRYEYRELRASA